uniref:Uncharacterized protein n=1 Tax=Ananas comosus var. bracteatus TaxID=296719 RepID=A0A6V7QDU9_ANACO|nr:unnamed protein product [Ananas comosus var. bracteatus]
MPPPAADIVLPSPSPAPPLRLLFLLLLLLLRTINPLSTLLLPIRLLSAPMAENEEEAAAAEEELSLLPIQPLESKRRVADEDDDGEERAYEAREKIVVAIDGEGEGDEDADEEGGGGGGSVPPFSWRKLWLFTGPGFLMSIAFLDPGNLEGDLQAGAIAGYSLLWLLLWATAMGLLIQMLSARLGVATGGTSRSSAARSTPRGRASRSDPKQRVSPLWAGVVITAMDCFIFLFLENYGVRKLEAVFALLIATMAFSFAWMFGETKPSGKELLMGILIPKLGSKTIRQAVGVVGCVIMPTMSSYIQLLYSQEKSIQRKKPVFAKPLDITQSRRL